MSSHLRRIERRILVKKGKGMRITELNPELSHRQAQRGVVTAISSNRLRG